MTGAKLKKKPESDKKKGKASLIDKYIGARLQQRRVIMNLTQNQLAEALGITFQQVQKYEKGINRISASRLYQISNALEVPVNFFFDNDELDAYAQNFHSSKTADSGELKETMNLLKMFYAIQDPKLRRNLIQMAKTLAQEIK